MHEDFFDAEEIPVSIPPEPETLLLGSGETEEAAVPARTAQTANSGSPLAVGNFQHAFQMARMLSNSAMVPTDYRGHPENCMVALETAHRLKLSPLVVMQSLYVVKGKPGWSSSFLIGLVNARAGLQSPIDWIIEKADGKRGLVVTAFATRKDGVTVEFPVSWERAVAEGWTTNAKYQTMPVVMLQYRSASGLIKLHWPHISLGFYTAEELETIPDESHKPTAADIEALPVP